MYANYDGKLMFAMVEMLTGYLMFGMLIVITMHHAGV